jgi:hypothetical protein
MVWSQLYSFSHIGHIDIRPHGFDLFWGRGFVHRSDRPYGLVEVPTKVLVQYGSHICRFYSDTSIAFLAALEIHNSTITLSKRSKRAPLLDTMYVQTSCSEPNAASADKLIH